MIEIMITHRYDEVRIQASRVFNVTTGNNESVQEFATKYGAVNLTYQFERENTPKMKEAILSSLSSFLKAKNFVGKRQYVGKCEGV